MLAIPRFALGTFQTDADSRPLTWALLQLFSLRGLQPQHFFSRCCFGCIDGALTATGQSSRYLDSWLMTEPLCRELFERGTRGAEIAVVEGCFEPAGTAGLAIAHEALVGGRLETLSAWLQLPRLAIVDVSRVVYVSARPVADALLLDCVRDDVDFAAWQSRLESEWGLPVLGGLELLPELRAAITNLPVGGMLPGELSQALARSCQQLTNEALIAHWAGALPDPAAPEEVEAEEVPRLARPTTIAVAYDEAFSCHFLDTHDALEARGATVVDFSPLRDEALPPDVDVVYLGSGRPDRYALELTENHCLRAALQKHLCAGRRIYAEGGGLAFLCQYLIDGSGQQVPLLGALPARIAFERQALPPVPVELRLAANSWLGASNTSVRGYWNRNWRLEALGDLHSLVDKQHVSPESPAVGLWRNYQAIGSQVYLNFATQPAILSRLVEPTSRALTT